MLKKLFIKNYKDISNPTVRTAYGTVAGVFGIVTNVILCVAKMIIGLLAGSITVIADAVNNLTDAGSSLLTVIGFKLSNKPADKDHPYGHERYENITALIVALLVFAVGILFTKSCIEKIISPEEVSVSVITFVILGLAILGKVLQIIVYIDFGKTIDSKALRAAATDTRNDILSTSATLIAMIVIRFLNVNIDAYVGLLVSLFILYSSVKMIAETVNPLLGVPPTKETVSELKNIILENKRILGVHDLIIHSYGRTKNFASAHVEVNSSENILEIHDIIDNIERVAYEKMKILLSLHLDPVDVKDKSRKEYAKICQKVLKELDPELSFHDFRIVKGDTHTNIVFDVVSSADKKISKQEIIDKLQKAFEKKGTFYFVIEIDQDYCSQ